MEMFFVQEMWQMKTIITSQIHSH